MSLAEVNGSLVATGGIYESTRYARMESLEVSGASNVGSLLEASMDVLINV